MPLRLDPSDTRPLPVQIAAALREAREETVVEGDSRRYGWLAWVAALVIVGSGLAIWLG